VLREDRFKQLSQVREVTNRKLIGLLKGTKLANGVNNRGRISINYNTIWRSGKRTFGDLTRRELESLRTFIERNLFRLLESCIDLQAALLDPQDRLSIFCGGKLRYLSKMSSKEIRLTRSDKTPICQYKIGLDLTVAEAHTWLYNLNKITSIKLRNVILRTAHGDVYCKERLYRFGLVDSPTCSRCDQVETIDHKILECRYASMVAKELLKTTNLLRTNPVDISANITTLMGVVEPNESILTIHAEVISRILGLRDTQNYLMRPKCLIRNSIEHLARCEKDAKRKDIFKTLLQQAEL